MSAPSPNTGSTRAPRRFRRLRRLALIVVTALAATQVIGMATSKPGVGHFRTAADADAYKKAYGEALATMPTPTRTIDVTTSFGTVRVYEWAKAGTGAPVLLLPGRGSGVPMWAENLPSIAKHRTVYAFDALGDAGLSAQTAPLTSTADQAIWIDETLGELGIDKAHVVGHSFGASSAAALAVNRPDRVASLTLLEPAFVLNWPPASVLLWSIPASLPFLPQSWRDAAVARVAGEDVSDIKSDDPVAQMILRGGSGYSADLPTPTPVSEDALRALPMPVYVALADASPITKGRTAGEHAALIKDAEVKVWPNTTHSLPMQVAEPLADELADFWARHDA